MEECEVNIDEPERENVMTLPQTVDQENTIPILTTESGCSLRSLRRSMARRKDHHMQQTTFPEPPSNPSIDQIISHLRQDIQERESELGKLQCRIRTKNRVLHTHLAGELRVLQERQANTDSELIAKLAERAALGPTLTVADADAGNPVMVVSDQPSDRIGGVPSGTVLTHLEFLQPLLSSTDSRKSVAYRARDTSNNILSDGSIDRDITKLRRLIGDYKSEIAEVRQTLDTSDKKRRVAIYHELQVLYKTLDKAKEELEAKTVKRLVLQDAFQDDSAAAQGSQQNHFAIESSPEPEVGQDGTQDNPVEIDSSPEPESRSGSGVRWIADDLLDALELEAQWLREGFGCAAEELIGELDKEIDDEVEELDEIEETERTHTTEEAQKSDEDYDEDIDIER
jgi:hypothetical protein